jgi:hypothetical protein
MDITQITYTDDEGVERNALDYLMADGDLACFSRYGARTSDCAPVALLLFAAQVDGGCEDSVNGLDGCMSMVVNDSEEVAMTILDSRHVYGDGFDPLDYFDEDDIADARAYYDRAYCGEPCPF